MSNSVHIHILKNGRTLLTKLIDGSIAIGNKSSADIRISECQYPLCATITLAESKIMINPEISDYVLVNNELINNPFIIREGDSIVIEGYQFQLQSNFHAEHTATLTDSQGNDSNNRTLPVITFLGNIEVSFCQLFISIGRGSTCDYIIPKNSNKYMTVSRKHAEIFCSNGKYFIRDFNSKAGIKVNRQQITSRPLPEKGIISLGKYELSYIITNNKPQAKADIIEIPSLDPNLPPKQFIGQSDAFNRLIMQLERVKNTDQSIFLCGETGTGKGMCARYLHFNNQKRCKHPFILVNCATISHQLAESQLFGHMRGSFTGATTDHTGFFEQANHGTLFLDEFTELPLDMQAKMLHVLEENIIRKIGAKKDIFLNVRILFATNQDVQHLISKKKFREDLYYRCNKIIHVPALRERKDDIPLLVNHFLKEAPYTISIQNLAMEQLIKYTWPGNTRELASCIGHAIMNASSNQSYFIGIDELELPKSIPSYMNDLPHMEKGQSPADRIKSLLFKYKGNVACASKALKISRRTLYNKMEKYNIDPSDFRE